jgi:hypothetical protein
MVAEDTMSITGMLDWGRAAIAHPLADFDFGEWDTTLFELWEPSFEQLRKALWASYCRTRKELLPRFPSVHLFFSLAEAVYFCRLQDSGYSMTEWQKQRLAGSLANLHRASELLFE